MKKPIKRKDKLSEVISISPKDDRGRDIRPRTWKEVYEVFDYFVEYDYKPGVYVMKPEGMSYRKWNKLLEELHGMEYIAKGIVYLDTSIVHGRQVVKEYDVNEMRENLALLEKYLSNYVEEEYTNTPLDYKFKQGVDDIAVYIGKVPNTEMYRPMLFITNIPFNVREDDLRALLMRAGYDGMVIKGLNKMNEQIMLYLLFTKSITYNELLREVREKEEGDEY